jgi:hypothetical protein
MSRQKRSSVHDEEKGKELKGVCSHENYDVSSLFSDIVLPAPSYLATGSDDPCTKMWLLSILQAAKNDAAIAEGWKADMDGILIYVRLNI